MASNHHLPTSPLPSRWCCCRAREARPILSMASQPASPLRDVVVSVAQLYALLLQKDQVRGFDGTLS